MKKVKITRELPYVFTEAEITEKGRKLAELNNQVAVKVQEKKAVMSVFKGQIDSLYEEMNSETLKITEGRENRETECEVTYHHPKEGQKTIARMDDGETWVEQMSNYDHNLFNQPEEKQWKNHWGEMIEVGDRVKAKVTIGENDTEVEKIGVCVGNNKDAETITFGFDNQEQYVKYGDLIEPVYPESKEGEE